MPALYKPRRTFFALAALSLALFSLSGCGPAQSESTRLAPEIYPYRITATVGMITDIVVRVAGEHAVVEGIIGQGVDPHLYKPTTSDVKKFREADVIFYNGLMLEGKMGDVLVKVATSGKPVHAVTESLLGKSGYVLTDEGEHYDPHVWMDVRGWKLAVDVVANALADFDVPNADSYRANAAAFQGELDALDDYARKVIGSIPEQQRVLVTAHDAFNYMARAYGLEVRGIQGISTESEAGVKDIENARLLSWPRTRNPRRIHRILRLRQKCPRPRRRRQGQKPRRHSSAANSSPTPWAKPAPMKAPTSE